MTREECEDAIKQKILEIRDIAAKYMQREPTWLSADWSSNYEGYVSIRNSCLDKDVPIDQHWFGVNSEPNIKEN